ncbi:hypothetical protein ACCM60_07050 [Pseudomonas chlororaphis subsp. aureofaciens]|uniref:hypothetical protein n=1 Tax=Pseudomonas chlororaphis TaxID=587753 RepID=UPI003556FF04
MKLSKTSCRYTWLFLFVTAIIAVGAGWSWNRGQGMDEKILMRASFDEPPFDASPWFADGKYQRVPNDDQQLFPGLKYSPIIMMRTSPQPFTDDEVRSLRLRIYMALTDPLGANFSPQVPKSVEGFGPGSDYDPRSQVVYINSGFRPGFAPPGVAFDYYKFYALLGGERFFVAIVRDGETGEIISTHRMHSFGIPKDEEERRFQELQSKADHQARLDAPGLKKRSGELCPWPGIWECLELPVGQQTFAYNYPFPQINGQDVTWRHVR